MGWWRGRGARRGEGVEREIERKGGGWWRGRGARRGEGVEREIERKGGGVVEG